MAQSSIATNKGNHETIFGVTPGNYQDPENTIEVTNRDIISVTAVAASPTDTASIEFSLDGQTWANDGVTQEGTLHNSNNGPVRFVRVKPDGGSWDVSFTKVRNRDWS